MLITQWIIKFDLYNTVSCISSIVLFKLYEIIMLNTARVFQHMKVVNVRFTFLMQMTDSNRAIRTYTIECMDVFA